MFLTIFDPIDFFLLYFIQVKDGRLLAVCGIFFLIKWWSYSVEGLLSTGRTPSSFNLTPPLYCLTCQGPLAKIQS